MFFFLPNINITNFADDTTPYEMDKSGVDHKMTITCLKCYFQKLQPKIGYYRNYKLFDGASFRNQLENELNKLNEDNLNYDAIKETLVTLWTHTRL